MTRRSSSLWASLLAYVALLAAAALPARASVPPGFVDEVIKDGFNLPVAIAFDGTGRLFVAEKRGIVRVIQNGLLLPTPFIDLVAEVHDAGDKGMLGLALDPDFATNRRVYLLYNVDPNYGQPDEVPDAITFGRLVRYTADASGNVANLTSRLVLLGHTAADGIANCYASHGVGTLAFGTDGTLFVSAGEGAHFDFPDGGEDVTGRDPGCAAMFGAQDIGALRAQDIDGFGGKILRIDPSTGLGLPDNPFFDGSSSSYASRIWARGLRNPFRFTVRPGTTAPGTLYVGDVGWELYEEINVAYGGENFGWPCWEGFGEQASYRNHYTTSWFCQALDDVSVTPPVLSWHHYEPGSLGFVGVATSGTCFYTGTAFPPEYQGKCFFADFGTSWIRVADFDDQDRLMGIASFGEDLYGPVDLEMDPITEDLVYASVATGTVRRIRWALGSHPPVVQISANPTAGGAPLEVQFSSDGTYDPNGDAFRFEWQFGDGSSFSSEANPIHTYSTEGTFLATLVVEDVTGLSSYDTVVIETANLPPVVNIVNPPHGSTFTPGETMVFSANAFDPEDGANIQYSWNVQLIHNEHIHPGWHFSSAQSPYFVAWDHGGGLDRSCYMIILTVFDTGGLASADTSVILPDDQGPNQSPIATITASPHEGQTPLVVTLSASDSVDPDGDYLFYAWSFGDGTTGAGASTTHIYSTPGAYSITLVVTDPALTTGTTSAAVLVDPAGTIAKWKVDEESGATAFDASGNGHHASLFGGPARVPGVSGRALEFDAQDDGASAGTNLLSDRSAFTLTAWIRPRATAALQGIVGQNDAIELGFISPGNIQIRTSGGGKLTVPYPFAMNEWHHVAATGDGERLRVYYDGVLASFAPTPTSSYGASPYPLRFGGGGIFDESWGAFHGTIDDVRVFDAALSPESIALIATAPPANSPPLVDAGSDLTTDVGAPVTLFAEVSDDGLPAPPGQVAVFWSQSSGPAPASIADPDRIFTLLTCPALGLYSFQITVDDGELVASDDVSVTAGGPTGVGLLGTPEGLRPIQPNPFRLGTDVSFGVAREGARVRLTIHDVGGRRIAVLRDGVLSAGEHRATWNAFDQSGRPVAAGVYFVVLDVDGRRSVDKVTLLR